MPIGIYNGNWRGAEWREYVQDLRLDLGEKVLHELGSCGHELKNRPLWMVGKYDICYDCYLAQKQIVNIAASLGAEAVVIDTSPADWEQAEDLGRHTIISGGEALEL